MPGAPHGIDCGAAPSGSAPPSASVQTDRGANLVIPELSLVVLIGPSGAGKSTFAAAHFAVTEVLSSDALRGMVSDDENDQGATRDAFDVLHGIAAKRLQRGRLTVIDATSVQPEARRPLLALAKQYHVVPVAIVFDLPEETYQERNRMRREREVAPHVIRHQSVQLQRSVKNLKQEGFRHVYVLDSPEQIGRVTVDRQPMPSDRRHEHGPFDIIGDVHGCIDELIVLLRELGWVVAAGKGQGTFDVIAPAGRRAVFLGDLVDRGPDASAVLRLVMRMVEQGSALCLPGNHDVKLMKALNGRPVQVGHGLERSLAQLEAEPLEFRSRVAAFIDSLASHYVFDDGSLVAAHAGMIEKLQGRSSRRVRDFALYGDTTGKADELGLPVRNDWAARYRGSASVVYGHTPVAEPVWRNNTINIDTGCVFGGRLTALRYPERELVSVAAREAYAESARPF